MLAPAATIALFACAPTAPCTAEIAYDLGLRGQALPPACVGAPDLALANDEGFAMRRRLDRVSNLPNDLLSGRRRITPGATQVAPPPPTEPPE